MPRPLSAKDEELQTDQPSDFQTPEPHFGIAEVQCRWLCSYSRTAIYKMLDDGELRGSWQWRRFGGTLRRHWSIPLSAIVEFLESLHSNRKIRFPGEHRDKKSGARIAHCFPPTEQRVASPGGSELQNGPSSSCRGPAPRAAGKFSREVER